MVSKSSTVLAAAASLPSMKSGCSVPKTSAAAPAACDPEQVHHSPAPWQATEFVIAVRQRWSMSKCD